MRSLHAGSSSKHARRRAKIEPALAPPAGESLSSRSAQEKRRCTCIKRALVQVGGATHARIVFELPRDAPAGRQEALEGRMMLVRA